MLAGTTRANDGIPWVEAVRRGGGQGSVWPSGRLASILGLPLWTIPYLEILPGLCLGGSERAWASLSWSFIPFRLGASSSFSTAPTSGPGWAQHQLGQSAAKHHPPPRAVPSPLSSAEGVGGHAHSHTHMGPHPAQSHLPAQASLANPALLFKCHSDPTSHSCTAVSCGR